MGHTAPETFRGELAGHCVTGLCSDCGCYLST